MCAGLPPHGFSACMMPDMYPPRRPGKTRQRRIRRSVSGNQLWCLTLLVVFFPRHRAFNCFFPASITVITFGGFDARTELALNHRFLV